MSGDTRELRPRILAGEERSTLAWAVFVHRLQAGIGQMLAALGDAPQAFVFTDAISEDEPTIRTAACAPFGFLGLRLDEALNRGNALDTDIAAADSRSGCSFSNRARPGRSRANAMRSSGPRSGSHYVFALWVAGRLGAFRRRWGWAFSELAARR